MPEHNWPSGNDPDHANRDRADLDDTTEHLTSPPASICPTSAPVPGGSHPPAASGVIDQFAFDDTDIELSVGNAPLDDATEFDVQRASPPVNVLGFLVVAAPLSRRGTVFRLQGIARIGRYPHNSIVLDDGPISKNHAVIRPIIHPDGTAEFELEDRASANGTFLNGARVQGAAMLAENDVICLGRFALVLKIVTLPDG